MDTQKQAQKLQEKGAELFHKKKYKEALSVFRKSEELAPDNVETWFNIASSLAELGKNTEALPYIEKVLEKQPQNAQAMYSMGLLHQNMDDRWMAMHWYTKALEQEPNLPMVFNNIGKLFYDYDGDYKKSIEQMEKALEAAPDPLDASLAVAYKNLGKMHRQMLNHDKAEYYKQKWFECQGLLELYWLGKDKDGDSDD